MFEEDKALKNCTYLVWLRTGSLGASLPLTLGKNNNQGPAYHMLNMQKLKIKKKKSIKYVLSSLLNKFTFIITWKKEYLGFLEFMLG